MSEQPQLQMGFDPDRDLRPLEEVSMVGRENLREQLARAHRTDRFPDTLLLAGPAGVGKARLSGWAAQALVCRASKQGGPCRDCPACRLSARLEMPDIHWYFPHENPESGSLDSQIEGLEAQQEKRRRARAQQSLHPGPKAGESYYLSTVKAIQRQAWRKPAMADRKVFVVTEAERLSPQGQTSSPAANTFLKLLEEPPPGTHFLLTSSSPYRLPDTVRSRAAHLRLSPLSKVEMEEIFDRATSQPIEGLEEVMEQSEGSIRRALSLLNPETRKQRQQALNWLAVLLEGAPLQRAQVADQQGFSGARTTFSAHLAELEQLILEASRRQALEEGLTGKQAGRDVSELLAQHRSVGLKEWAKLLELVTGARKQALANGNPRLILHDLLIQASTVSG